jgi:DedD protein
MKDDLLNMEPKKDLKKPLIYGAVGFLVFIIIVIAVAIFQNSNSKEKNNEIVPPVENNITVKEETTEFKPLNIEETPKKSEEKVNATPLEVKQTEAPKQIQPKTEQKPKNTEDKIELPQETKQTETKKEVQPQKTAVKKQTAPAHKTIKEGKYYIQVAALLKNATPNKKFLKLIKNQGFDYRFYHTYIIKNSQKIKVTKILIGPFKSKKEAQKALPKIKRTISKTAFIFKVK